MTGYDFDEYQGRLYRIFEGTVLEGVVTNHIDGGLSGPILIMLTTDYYSQRPPAATHAARYKVDWQRAECRKRSAKEDVRYLPSCRVSGWFLARLRQYVGLTVGNDGLATNVDHGYLQAFAAAAAVGGLGGLAQNRNNGSVLSPSTDIRNGISGQAAQEGEQVLNHFLNRLPIITLNEGSRARVYIGRDILIPSYAEHHVDPTL